MIAEIIYKDKLLIVTNKLAKTKLEMENYLKDKFKSFELIKMKK